MLLLTETARAIVRDITTSPDAPEDAGLRISPEPDDETAFAITAAPAPGPADQVVLHEGATIYVDPRAVLLLDDKLLDASVDEEGQIVFALTPQQRRSTST